MNKLLSSAPAAVLCAACLFATTAQAHQIWIEQPAGQNAVIRFGEFGDNLREASPGLLDKFGKPAATLISAKGERAAHADKSAAGFALPFKADGGDAIVAEDALYPLYAFKQGEREVKNWYRPAARFVTTLAPQEPRLPLDIVPAGAAGAFKVFFKGQPLAKAKVALVTPSGWAREGQTDAQGLVKLDMPWKGTYVAEASHTDRTPGERQGLNGPEAYDGVNHVTTLTYVKPGGLAPVHAGPVATPSR